MAVKQRSGTRLALAVCCGALAVPATASADHMGDMPWCPHANVQGADPADQVPGAGGGSTAAGAPSTAPLGTRPTALPSSSSSAPGGQATRPSGAGATQQVAATQPATVTQGVQSAGATTATVAARAAATPEVRAKARAKARAAAQAQARREARGLARARAVVQRERARMAQGARLVLQTRMTTAERWLTETPRDAVAGRSILPAPAGILVALLTLAGLTAGFARLRRSGGSGDAGVVLRAPAGSPGAHSAAVEAELQEMLAEERAARAADERSPVLSG